MGIIILVIYLYFLVSVYEYKLKSYPSIRDNGSPGKYAYYGGEWDTGGLLEKPNVFIIKRMNRIINNIHKEKAPR